MQHKRPVCGLGGTKSRTFCRCDVYDIFPCFTAAELYTFLFTQQFLSSSHFQEAPIQPKMFFLLVVAIALVGADANTTSSTAPTPPSTPTTGIPSDPGSFDVFNSIDSDSYAAAEIIDNATTVTHFMVTPTSANCKNLDFDWAISEVKGTIEVHGEFCLPSTDSWSLSTAVKLKILGHSLINDKYVFSPRFSEVRKKLNLLAAKIDVTLGVYNYCIRIVGNACYWAGKYRCADIWEQPYCFKKNLIKASTYSGPINYDDNLFPAVTYSQPLFVNNDDCNARLKKIADLAKIA